MATTTPLLLAVLLPAFVALAHAKGLTPAAADGVTDAVVPDPLVTISEYIAASPNHKVLTALVGTIDDVSGPLADETARLTLFAPTDGAFARLATRFAGETVAVDDTEGILTALTDGFDSLSGKGHKSARSTVLYHGIGSLQTYEALLARRKTDGLTRIKSLEPGAFLRFNETGVVDWDRDNVIAAVLTRNILNLNGWVHIVDDVLIPFNLQKVLRQENPGVDVTPPERAPEPVPTTPMPEPVEPTATPTIEPSKPAKETPEPKDPNTGTDGGDEKEGTPSPGPDGDGDGDGDDTDTEPTASPDDDGICFPATARVHVAGGGTVAMRDLQPGTSVVHNEQQKEHSPIFLFTHRAEERKARFLRISTACRHVITLTKNHYLHAANGGLMAADAVRVGDELRTVDGACVVERVENVHAQGLYAPHSMHGDLVVDGFVVSGYSRAVSPRVAHALLFPVRFFVKLAGVSEPLGRAFYDGGDWALRFLPRGNDVY